MDPHEPFLPNLDLIISSSPSPSVVAFSLLLLPGSSSSGVKGVIPLLPLLSEPNRFLSIVGEGGVEAAGEKTPTPANAGLPS